MRVRWRPYRSDCPPPSILAATHSHQFLFLYIYVADDNSSLRRVTKLNRRKRPGKKKSNLNRPAFHLRFEDALYRELNLRRMRAGEKEKAEETSEKKNDRARYAPGRETLFSRARASIGALKIFAVARGEEEGRPVTAPKSDAYREIVSVR